MTGLTFSANSTTAGQRGVPPREEGERETAGVRSEQGENGTRQSSDVQYASRLRVRSLLCENACPRSVA
jgi:hypothetical protein